jgi:hypothetical protein
MRPGAQLRPRLSHRPPPRRPPRGARRTHWALQDLLHRLARHEARLHGPPPRRAPCAARAARRPPPAPLPRAQAWSPAWRAWRSARAAPSRLVLLNGSGGAGGSGRELRDLARPARVLWRDIDGVRLYGAPRRPVTGSICSPWRAARPPGRRKRFRPSGGPPAAPLPPAARPLRSPATPKHARPSPEASGWITGGGHQVGSSQQQAARGGVGHVCSLAAHPSAALGGGAGVSVGSGTGAPQCCRGCMRSIAACQSARFSLRPGEARRGGAGVGMGGWGLRETGARRHGRAAAGAARAQRAGGERPPPTPLHPAHAPPPHPRRQGGRTGS